MIPALAHCAALVRRHDYDRYLCSLFAAGEARGRLFALYAFNHEVARLGERVGEAALGAIRLQWWRNAVAGLHAGSPNAHPVIQALAAVRAADWLPRQEAEALIDARWRDFDTASFADRAALTAYVDGTAGAAAHLALAALHAESAAARDAARAAGRVWGLCGLARSVPFRAHALLNAGDPVRLPAAWAEEYLADLPVRAERKALPALLPASLARLYLARLKQADYAPEHPLLRPSRAVRQWRVVAHWVSGRL